MKKVYVKPLLTMIELRPEERIGACTGGWLTPQGKVDGCIKTSKDC